LGAVDKSTSRTHPGASHQDRLTVTNARDLSVATDPRLRPGSPSHDDRGRRGTGPRRAGVFTVGLALNLLGVAAWLLSVLLTAPLLLAGLWVWSREFEWAKRLLTRCHRWAGSLWRRVKAHPQQALRAAGADLPPFTRSAAGAQ